MSLIKYITIHHCSGLDVFSMGLLQRKGLANIIVHTVYDKYTVMILSFRTDRFGQTVQTQIRSSLIRVYTVCNFVCIFWSH